MNTESLNDYVQKHATYCAVGMPTCGKIIFSTEFHCARCGRHAPIIPWTERPLCAECVEDRAEQVRRRYRYRRVLS